MSLTKDSVVVITGAASGIGRALAMRFAKERIAGIAIADVNEERLAETTQLLGEQHFKVTSQIVDVSNADAVREFAEAVAAEHGRVTHVINNAGVALGGTVREVSLDEIEWLMGVNFWGVVHGTKFFLPYLEKENSAHIVNISSIFGVVAPPGQAAYCASKFAVRGFTEALRHELEGTNIAVSVVHPGGVATNIATDAKVSKGVTATQQEIEKKTARMNRKLANTTPEQAADIIVRGILNRETRILVGSDAKMLSAVTRLFPRKYLAVANRISGGGLEDR